MAVETVDNRRIARNSLMLYVRMSFNMCIILYTSRVVLQVLGVEDFGIYNVVGGVALLITVINGAMEASTQRFITFALGTGDRSYLERIFANGVLTHVIISLVMWMVIEVLGLWLLYNKLNIPADRMEAAFWALQCSILLIVVRICTIPFNAVIIAHEAISAFAYISVLDVLLRLVAVLVLPFFSFDRLIVYAVLQMLVQILICLLYVQYGYRHFFETHCRLQFDRNLFHEMMSFAGWSLTEQVAVMSYAQGLNILLNIFFGPRINAARVFALQAQNAISQVATNFQTAINPQITKSYASGNREGMHMLVLRSCRLAFCLVLIVALPILSETEVVLRLWIKEPPEWTIGFVRMLVCCVTFDAMSNPLMVSVQATGQVKRYQIIISSILLTILPLSYIVLRYGGNPLSVFVVQFAITVLAFVARLLIVGRMIVLPLSRFLREVVLPCLMVSLGSIPLTFAFHCWIADTLLGSLVVMLISVVVLVVCVWLWGLSAGERSLVVQYCQRFKRNKSH